MKIAILSLLILICFNVFSQINDKSVTIPLKEYEDLKRQLEIPSIMVIEKLTLGGSFKNEKFDINIKGRMLGKPKKEILLNNFTENLKNCSGDGIFTIDQNNVFFMPLKDNFKASCEIELSKTGNISLSFLNVLYLENQIAESESIIRKDAPNVVSIDVLRKFAEIKKAKGKVILNGRYRVTINPNSTNFQYSFEFNNPNQNKEKITIPFKNSEVIESIESELNVKEMEKGIEVELNPGENYVVINGHFEKNEFASPLASENQFFLIESHPLVQVVVNTKWRRITSEESGIAPTQVNSKSFFINQEQGIIWEIKKLKVFSSLGFSVSDASYLYYIPKKGKGIIEATFRLDNKGTPEIPFKIDGDLVYAELDGQAIPMLKDDLDQLLISMSQGYHEVKFQYLPKHKMTILGGINGLKLARPESIISQSNFNLRFDKAWSLVFGTFSSDNKSFIGGEQLVNALVFFIIVFILFTCVKISKRFYLPVLILVTLILLIKPCYISYAYLTMVVVFLIRYRENIKKVLSGMKLAKIIIVAGLLLISGGAYYFIKNAAKDVYTSINSGGQLMSNVTRNYSNPGMGRSLVKMEASPEVLSDSFEKESGQQTQNQMEQSGFEGIPARIEIPSSGYNYYFSSSLLEANGAIKFCIMAIKTYLISLILLVLVVAAGICIYLNRQEFKRDLLNIT